ncbi:hypothetical protein [Clostridium paraputrificum]|uniref:hypothetical protein n=1 Tax=Clostridium paraputrificum TaxID=29363 RepID=UPI0018A01637|nr:hypothetical protein [Clostridium paraputrificum]
MVNVKKLLMTLIVACTVMIIPNNVTIANASTTLSYKEVDGVQCVNIIELAKLKGEQLSEATHEVYGKGYNITLNGKSITIYEEAPYIFVDGRMTVLKTEVISADGLEYNFPVMQKPTKEGDGFLIPMFVVEKSLGIKGTEEGIVVETPKEDEKENINTGNSNSNSGSNNSGNNGNSGNTTLTPKPDPTPTPDQKPEQPSGMSFSTFASKLPGMGFDGSGVYWENGQKMGVVYATSGEATFSLRQNSASFDSVIKNCLNMLLPTGGNKVYNIVSSSFSNQTIEVDGRVVSMEQTSVGVGIKIYNK